MTGVAEECKFVSRGGLKLDAALAAFGIDVSDTVCVDLGCSTGGFTDCLLQRGAAKVYAVDTGYGVLDWSLRNNARVVVMERTNAMHITLPQAVDWAVIDAGWTRQRHILPAARKLLAARGSIVTLVKPHYEAEAKVLRKGILPKESLAAVLDSVRRQMVDLGFEVVREIESPIKGAKGNTEQLMWLRSRATGG